MFFLPPHLRESRSDCFKKRLLFLCFLNDISALDSFFSKSSEKIKIEHITQENLLSLDFLMPNQVDAYLDYIHHHGAIVSRDELYAIPHWREETIEAFSKHVDFPMVEKRKKKRVNGGINALSLLFLPQKEGVEKISTLSFHRKSKKKGEVFLFTSQIKGKKMGGGGAIIPLEKKKKNPLFGFFGRINLRVGGGLMSATNFPKKVLALPRTPLQIRLQKGKSERKNPDYLLGAHFQSPKKLFQGGFCLLWPHSEVLFWEKKSEKEKSPGLLIFGCHRPQPTAYIAFQLLKRSSPRFDTPLDCAYFSLFQSVSGRYQKKNRTFGGEITHNFLGDFALQGSYQRRGSEKKSWVLVASHKSPYFSSPFRKKRSHPIKKSALYLKMIHYGDGATHTHEVSLKKSEKIEKKSDCTFDYRYVTLFLKEKKAVWRGKIHMGYRKKDFFLKSDLGFSILLKEQWRSQSALQMGTKFFFPLEKEIPWGLAFTQTFTKSYPRGDIKYNMRFFSINRGILLHLYAPAFQAPYTRVHQGYGMGFALLGRYNAPSGFSIHFDSHLLWKKKEGKWVPDFRLRIKITYQWGKK